MLHQNQQCGTNIELLYKLMPNREKYKSYLQTLIKRKLRQQYKKFGKIMANSSIKKDQIINELLELYDQNHKSQQKQEQSKEKIDIASQISKYSNERKVKGMYGKLQQFGLHKFTKNIKYLNMRALQYQINKVMQNQKQSTILKAQDQEDPGFISELNKFISKDPSTFVPFVNKLFLTKEQLQLHQLNLNASNNLNTSTLYIQLQQNAQILKNQIGYSRFLTEYHDKCSISSAKWHPSSHSSSIQDKYNELSNKLVLQKQRRFQKSRHQPFLSLLDQIKERKLSHHAQYFQQMEQTIKTRHKLYERALKYQSLTTIYLVMLLFHQFYALKSLSLRTISMIAYFMKITANISSIWTGNHKKSSPQLEIISKIHSIVIQFIILFKMYFKGIQYLNEQQLQIYVNTLSIISGIRRSYSKFANSSHLLQQNTANSLWLESLVMPIDLKYDQDEVLQLLDPKIRENIFESIGFIVDENSLNTSSLEEYSNLFLSIYEMIGKDRISKKEAIYLIKLMMKAIQVHKNTIYGEDKYQQMSNAMQNSLIVSKYSVYFSQKIKSIINEEINRWELHNEFELISQERIKDKASEESL